MCASRPRSPRRRRHRRGGGGARLRRLRRRPGDAAGPTRPAAALPRHGGNRGRRDDRCPRCLRRRRQHLCPGAGGRRPRSPTLRRGRRRGRCRATPGSFRACGSPAARRCRRGGPTGVRQRYLPGTNVVRTVASFGSARLTETAAARGGVLAVIARVRRGARASFAIAVEPSFECERGAARERGRARCAATTVRGFAMRTRERSRRKARAAAGLSPRRWRRFGKPAAPIVAGWHAPVPSGASAPRWARRMYVRSLLALRSLTATNGAAAAGAREGWAYVWPRDAATDALALAAAGYRGEARRVTRFLAALPVDTAARFDEAGAPVSGRGPQGDEAGWIDAAIAATSTKPRLARGSSAAPTASAPAWRNLPDYQEGAPGDYLGNAIAGPLAPPADGTKTAPYQRESARRPRGGVGLVPGIANDFGTARGLVRVAGDAGSGLDSAAAWAVRPFRLRALYPAARKTLLRLTAEGTRFGITPGEGLDRRRGPVERPDRLERLGPRRPRRRSPGPLGTPRRRRPPRRARPARRPAPRRHPGRRSAGAGRRRHPACPARPPHLLWSHALTVLALRELWPQTPGRGARAALRRPSRRRGSAGSGAGHRARR